MRVAEKQQLPLTLQIGVADPFAVLVDQLKRAADRAGEHRAGRAFRVVAESQRQQHAGGENQNRGEDNGGEGKARIDADHSRSLPCPSAEPA